MKKILSAVIFVAAFSIVELSAQVVYIPQLDPVHMYLQQQTFQQMAFSGMYKDKIVNGKKVRVRVAPPKAPAAKTVKSPTEFSPTGKRILTERLSAASNDPQSKQMFEACLDRYEKTARTDGFPANDLSYAFEFFIVNNYNVYNDLFDLSPADKALISPSGDPLLALQHSYSKKAGFVTSTAEKAVYQQIKTFLSANPAILKLTDRQKQEFTEMLAIVTMINFGMYETAGKNKDAEAFAKAQNAARQMLEKMLGTTGDKIKITAKGLEF